MGCRLWAVGCRLWAVGNRAALLLLRRASYSLQSTAWFSADCRMRMPNCQARCRTSVHSIRNSKSALRNRAARPGCSREAAHESSPAFQGRVAADKTISREGTAEGRASVVASRLYGRCDTALGSAARPSNSHSTHPPDDQSSFAGHGASRLAHFPFSIASIETSAAARMYASECCVSGLRSEMTHW